MKLIRDFIEANNIQQTSSTVGISILYCDAYIINPSHSDNELHAYVIDAIKEILKVLPKKDRDMHLLRSKNSIEQIKVNKFYKYLIIECKYGGITTHDDVLKIYMQDYPTAREVARLKQKQQLS